MDLLQIITTLKLEIKKAEELIEDRKLKINLLSTSEKVETKKLYEDILSVISFKETKGKYKYILGGDGRSQPWDETREGVVIKVTIKDKFLISREQIRVVKQYFVNTKEVCSDQITFTNKERIIY